MMLQAQLVQPHATKAHKASRPPAAVSLKSWNHGHLQPRRLRVRQSATEDGPVGGKDLSDIMKQDMQRFAVRQQAAASSSSGAPQQVESAGGGLKEVIDKVLIADFFFVLAILAWLGVGLAEKATVQSSSLIDAWLPLWPLVFQPAIGVLMAGALVSGGLNWLQEQQQKK